MPRPFNAAGGIVDDVGLAFALENQTRPIYSDLFFSDSPGPDFLFDGAVYGRGAMTLHQLRQKIGDEAFFELLQRWAPSEVGRSVTTDEFIALAEEVSGMALDELFDIWLFAPEKPELD